MAILVDCELHKLRLSIWCFSVRNLRPWTWLTGLSLLEINCGALECFYFIWCAYSWGLTCLEWWRMVLVLPTHKWFSWEPRICIGLHQSQSTYLVRDFDYYISHVTLHISILTWFLVIFEARDTALLPSRNNRVSVWPHDFKLSLGLGYQIYRLNTCFQLKRKPYRCAIDYRYRLQVILILKKNGLRLQKKIILLKIKSNTSSHLNESRALYNYAYIFIVNIDYIYIFPFISPIFSHGASQAII